MSLQCSVPSHDFFLNVWSDIVSDLRHRSCEGIRWLRWHAAIRRIGRLWAAHTGCNVIILSSSKNPACESVDAECHWSHRIPWQLLCSKSKTMSDQMFRNHGIELTKESDGSGGTLPSVGSEGSGFLEPDKIITLHSVCASQSFPILLMAVCHQSHRIP